VTIPRDNMEIFGSSDHLYKYTPWLTGVVVQCQCFQEWLQREECWGRWDLGRWRLGRGRRERVEQREGAWGYFQGTGLWLASAERAAVAKVYNVWYACVKKKQVMRIGNHTRNFLTSMRKRVIGVIGSRIGEGMTTEPSGRWAFIAMACPGTPCLQLNCPFITALITCAHS